MNSKIFKIFLFTLFILFSSCIYKAEAIPEVSAKSYIVIDSDSGRIIGSRNPNEKLPIASTTKILTAILAIENIENIETRIEVPAKCVNIEGSSIYLQPRQIVSVKDLLYGTMLRSGNDAAATLSAFAERKSEDGFVDMMNKKAAELGALDSNFVNPHGLHDKNHYSTAYDLALISRYAMKTISSSEKYVAESMNTVFYNKNKVVYQYEYGNGIKIGYTKAAGRCLVASAEKDGTEIIVVVLNDGNWFQDSYKIFDWVFENYKTWQVVEEGQFAGRASDGTPVFIQDSFSYLMTEEEKDKIKVQTKITAPLLLNKDNKVVCGEYSIYLGNELIHSGSLVTENK